MIKKLLITPWFGDLPSWMPHWERNVVTHLQPHGYDVLRLHNLDEFNDRCERVLGFRSPIVPGEGKIHDYRCAFGLLFADEIQGYDFWGHTDFDCVYGRVQFWVTDDFLNSVDIHSNHHSYMCGPWSLYRNTPLINSLFMEHPEWENILRDDTSHGWVETGFSDVVDLAHEAGRLRRQYTFWQTRDLNRYDTLCWYGDALIEGDHEVFFAHFRRLNPKVYPAGAIR